MPGPGDAVSGRTGRSKVVALVLSGIFPGIGQFYNRQPMKGAGFLVAGAVLSWVAGRAVPVDQLMQNLLAGKSPLSLALILPLCLLLIVWCWSLVDAWRVAGR